MHRSLVRCALCAVRRALCAVLRARRPARGIRVVPPHAELHDRCSLPGLAGLAGQRWQDHRARARLGSIIASKDSVERCGERGIRTPGTFRHTRFPVVHLRPLGHLSSCPHAVDLVARTPGGGHGIRTRGTLAGTPDFESGALNHSANPPPRGLVWAGSYVKSFGSLLGKQAHRNARESGTEPRSARRSSPVVSAPRCRPRPWQRLGNGTHGRIADVRQRDARRGS
jgi:hypothetical protein